MAGGTALLAARPAFAADYDPTTPAPQSRAADHHYDRVVHDAARQRDTSVQIRHSARRMRMPIILFSHGLGGSRHGSEYLERWWTARGYVTVFLQHPGSDDAVWRNIAPGDRLPRNPNHHRAIESLSAAFWDSTIGRNPAATAWLDSDLARGVLGPADRWQRK